MDVSKNSPLTDFDQGGPALIDHTHCYQNVTCFRMLSHCFKWSWSFLAQVRLTSM